MGSHVQKYSGRQIDSSLHEDSRSGTKDYYVGNAGKDVRRFSNSRRTCKSLPMSPATREKQCG